MTEIAGELLDPAPGLVLERRVGMPQTVRRDMVSPDRAPCDDPDPLRDVDPVECLPVVLEQVGRAPEVPHDLLDELAPAVHGPRLRALADDVNVADVAHPGDVR